MELHQVRYFLKACETLNFTRAAELCGVSVPSLSRAIHQLEEELGGQLFRRERQLTHLTDLGRLMLQHLSTMNEAAEAAKRDLATLMDSPPDYFPDLSDEEKKAVLLDLSYLDFLTEHAKVHPDVVKYLFNVSSGWWSTGIDLFGCLEAWIAGYPGFKGMGLKWTA